MKNPKKDIHREPSARSLREMPEVDFSRAKVRKNPYAKRLAAEGFVVDVEVKSGKGRPRKGTEVGKTIPKSIRFPAETWEMLAQFAKGKGLSLHAALRAAILEWAKRAA